jgi:hypothetical protein
MEKHVIYHWSLNTKLFGPLNNVTWIMMLLGLKESCNYNSWKRYEMMLMRMQGFTKKIPKSLHDQMITRKEFHVGDKVLLYHSHLESYTLVRLDPLLFLLFFSYGGVEIISLETNKLLMVNGHRLKTFYEGWMAELTASIELNNI